MAHTFHHLRGGDSTYTHALTRELEDVGHEVIPLAMRHPNNVPSVWESRFVSWVELREQRGLQSSLALLRRILWSQEAQKRCQEIIEDYRPDICHIQHIHRHLTPSILKPLNLAGIPVVWTVHDYELICPEGHLFAPDGPCTRCKQHRYWEAVRHRCKWGAPIPSLAAALEKQFHRLMKVWDRVDHFLCPSAFLAQQLVNFGIPEHKVTALPNFMNVGPTPAPWKPGDGWLYAGRLTVEKGVDVAIEAARLVPDIPLRICGTGPELKSLKQRAEGLNHVHFLGHIPQSQLKSLILNARAIAVPSRWHENFPFAVLEAQALGRPVVASRMGGMPEQIEDGVDGLLIPANDPVALANAILHVCQNPRMAQTLGSKAAERVRTRLAPAHHMDHLLSIYDRVLGSNGSSG